MVANKKKGLSESSDEPDLDSQVETASALAELLDHLASELAQEYIRLMEKAAEDE